MGSHESMCVCVRAREKAPKILMRDAGAVGNVNSKQLQNTKGKRVLGELPDCSPSAQRTRQTYPDT